MDLDWQADRPHEKTVNIGGLKLPWRATVATMITCLLMMTDYYFDILNRFLPHETREEFLRNTTLDRVILYLFVPLLAIVLVFRESPATYGFRLGNWRAGVVITLVGWLIVTPVLYFAVKLSDVSTYYTAYRASPIDILLNSTFDLIGWEFMFRGFLLFALYRVMGPIALIMQMIPFALGHMGKPALETISTVFTGVAFGWTAWRTNSFLYAFLIHLYILTFTALLVNGIG